MRSIRVTRRYRFVASHRLHSPQLSETENDTTYGKCNNPYGHGHNYVLEVTAEGPVEERTGLAIHAPSLDALVQREVIARYDHRNLNSELPEYQNGLVPTTENVLARVEQRLRQAWPPDWPRLVRVRMFETQNNTFEKQVHHE